MAETSGEAVLNLINASSAEAVLGPRYHSETESHTLVLGKKLRFKVVTGSLVRVGDHELRKFFRSDNPTLRYRRAIVAYRCIDQVPFDMRVCLPHPRSIKAAFTRDAGARNAHVRDVSGGTDHVDPLGRS